MLLGLPGQASGTTTRVTERALLRGTDLGGDTALALGLQHEGVPKHLCFQPALSLQRALSSFCPHVLVSAGLNWSCGFSYN